MQNKKFFLSIIEERENSLFQVLADSFFGEMTKVRGCFHFAVVDEEIGWELSVDHPNGRNRIHLDKTEHLGLGLRLERAYRSRITPNKIEYPIGIQLVIRHFQTTSLAESATRGDNPDNIVATRDIDILHRGVRHQRIEISLAVL